MASITISELNPSSIAEINEDEMLAIKGGLEIAIQREYFEAVEGLQQISLLVVDEDLLANRDSLSVSNLSSLFEFTDVVPF